MAVIYVPRVFGGTLILNTTPQQPPPINVVWVTRDLASQWKTRDQQAAFTTRDDQATWKARQ